MIAEFEARLAQVLGGRLAPPLQNRVAAPPLGSLADGPRVVVAAERAEVLEEGFPGVLERVVPGAPAPRRIVRAEVTVGVTVHRADGGSRVQVVQGVDACLYTLDAPDLRSGTALAAGAPDPGFVLQQLLVRAVEPELGRLLLVAQGWFWPPGAPGQAGATIATVQIRGVPVPINVRPANPRPIAAGPPIDLTLHVHLDRLQTTVDDPPPEAPVRRLAVTLAAAGGGSPAGTLADAVDGVRLVPLVDGQAAVTYQPPAEPARDELVVALDNGADGVGIELGRAPLTVEAGP